MTNFFISLLLLLVAFVLQFFVAIFGLSFALAFAVLLASLFVLPFLEFFVLDLFAVSVLHGISVFSVPTMVFGLFPLLAWACYRYISVEPIVMLLIAVFVGVLCMALSSGLPFGIIGYSNILLDSIITGVCAIISFWFLRVFSAAP